MASKSKIPTAMLQQLKSSAPMVEQEKPAVIPSQYSNHVNKRGEKKDPSLFKKKMIDLPIELDFKIKMLTAGTCAKFIMEAIEEKIEREEAKKAANTK